MQQIEANKSSSDFEDDESQKSEESDQEAAGTTEQDIKK